MIQKHQGGKKPDISGRRFMEMKFHSGGHVGQKPNEHKPLTPHGEITDKAKHGEMEWNVAEHDRVRTDTRAKVLDYTNLSRTDPDVILSEIFEKHQIPLKQRHDVANLEKASAALEHDLESQRTVLRELQTADARKEDRMKLASKIVSLQNALDVARSRIIEQKRLV
jgi:hypothetical protein